MTMISNNYKYHSAIDEYIYLVKSKQVETNEDIKKMISLVEDKLSQPDVWLDIEKIDKAIEKITLGKIYSRFNSCILY